MDLVARPADDTPATLVVKVVHRAEESAPDGEQIPLRTMFDHAALTMLRWLRGKELTKSVDERERRAVAAQQVHGDPACPPSWLERT